MVTFASVAASLMASIEVFVATARSSADTLAVLAALTTATIASAELPYISTAAARTSARVPVPLNTSSNAASFCASVNIMSSPSVASVPLPSITVIVSPAPKSMSSRLSPSPVPGINTRFAPSVAAAAAASAAMAALSWLKTVNSACNAVVSRPSLIALYIAASISSAAFNLGSVSIAAASSS